MRAIVATLLLVSLLYQPPSYAQETSETEHIWDSDGLKVEIGTNASFFIGNFLNLTGLGDPIFRDPFGIHSRVIWNKFALSGAINGSLNNSERTETSNDIVRITNGYDFKYRLGVEYQHMVAKRWKLNLGIDYVGESTKFKNRTETNNSWSESLSGNVSHGFGPAIGFQYYINDKISLFTRSGVFYSFGNSLSESRNSSDPNNVVKTNVESQNILFSFPTSIFIAIQL